MGWISAITGLFGSSKNVETIVETGAKGIYNGLDMLVHTDEEKAIAKAEGVKRFLEYFDKVSSQNSIQSITRRWMAFLVMGPTILCFIVSMCLYPISSEMADHYFKLFTVMIPWAGGVLAFYFGPHLIGAKK